MNKSILLIITGGIAAYKALEFIRQIRREGIEVTPVLTQSALSFITPLSVAGVAGQKVHIELLSVTDEIEMGHIALSRKADAILVYPATANFMAKAAHGVADDLASTLLLATDTPVLMTPAMNVRMWQHVATQQNIETLQNRGVTVFEPDSGSMACGEYGPGRLIEPPVMVQHIKDFFGARKPLMGKTALVTTGATQEALDPVRYLTNYSSGKQGFAIAKALQAAGAEVTVIAGACQVNAPSGIKVVRVKSAAEMQQASLAVLPADIAICAAAVSDWTPLETHTHKQKKQQNQENLTITLKQTPDILASLATNQNRPELLIGFAAETENGLAHAQAKLKRKGCDWLILNEINTENPAFGADYNQVTILKKDGTKQVYPKAPKQQIAQHIVAEIINSQVG